MRATAHLWLMIIAIDGTSASGKGTLARRLAAIYGLAHMDTGSLYRATGVAAMRAGVDLDDAAELARIAGTLDLEAFEPLDLRSADAGQAASRVAAIGEVRAAACLQGRRRAFANLLRQSQRHRSNSIGLAPAPLTLFCYRVSRAEGTCAFGNGHNTNPI